MSYLAPIVLFVYNRLDHTRQTLEALRKNDLAKESRLIVYADGPKNEEDEEPVQLVRDYVKQNSAGFLSVEIVENETNKGLADSIVDGVTRVVNEYGKIIVLEDDIVTSPAFLDYMNQALDLYEDEPKVMHVAGYMYPIKNRHLPQTFFYPATSCWGWATWKRAWRFFNPDASSLYEQIKAQNLIDVLNINYIHDFEGQLKENANGRLHTWFIKWNASVILSHGYSLYPRCTFVQNIGFDGSGEHCESTNTFYCPNLSGKISLKKQKLVFNKRAIKILREFGGPKAKIGFMRACKRRIKKMIKTRFGMRNVQ